MQLHLYVLSLVVLCNAVRSDAPNYQARTIDMPVCISNIHIIETCFNFILDRPFPK